MLNDDHVVEMLPSYVMGGLEEEEAQQVSEHLRTCYICRAELDSFQNIADRLPLMAARAVPSDGLKLRLMEQVRGRKEKRNRQSWDWNSSRRLLNAGILAGILLIVLLAVSNLMLWQRLANSETLTGPLGMRAIVLQNTEAAPDASGFVIISADGQNGVLVVDELPMLEPEHEEYQLWLLKDGEFTSVNLFSVDEDGYRGMRLEAPEPLTDYMAVSLTIEPSGGSSQPTGEQVLGGSLFNP